MRPFKPTHEQHMTELIINRSSWVLVICVILIPVFVVIPAILPNATVPDKAWDIISIIISGILGYYYGYGSAVTPKT